MNSYAEEIIKSLRDDKNFLADTFGVVSIGMFGSCAAGNQNKGSDLDFLVELKAPRFDWLAGLQIYLEQKFDRKIDLIRKNSRLRNKRIYCVAKLFIRDFHQACTRTDSGVAALQTASGRTAVFCRFFGKTGN